MKKAVVIGGGFYGATIALYLKESLNFAEVTLIERERSILSRASFSNQARVHNGYHYPRSFTTAYRSRVNFPKFLADYEFAIVNDFEKLYAIPSRNSKITASQFYGFCKSIGADINAATDSQISLFDKKRIDQVFRVREYAFNTTLLKQHLAKRIESSGVKLLLNSTVTSVDSISDNELLTHYISNNKEEVCISNYLFNCTYSGINTLSSEGKTISSNIKHEITEMGLLQVPDELKSIGVTIMDGPFYSCMPFPSENMHTISHVRYTPHDSWIEDGSINPYKRISEYRKIFESRVNRMVRDASLYMPSFSKAEHVKSLLEVKTVLLKNEMDDGRPILFERHHKYSNFYSILGSKIDNIYDVFEKLSEILEK